MRLVHGIYRYPIKGLSPQSVNRITLQPGQPFPFDRVFALARPGVPIDMAAPKWAKKGLFIMLMLEGALAKVQTRLDVESLTLSVCQDGHDVLSADIGTPQGREVVEAFFRRLVPTLTGIPRLVRSPDSHFMDKPDNVLSLINLATVRDLEQQWGYTIDPLRFRANFYIDGARPWEEFDWIGSDILVGEVLCRVDRRNGRCGATNVNPRNGERDLDIPGSLRKAFGHKDLGVYLIVRKGGVVASGDAVQVPDFGNGLATSANAQTPAPSTTRSICNGCYFIYDDARTSATQDPTKTPTPFARLPANWACPDCGTDKSNFRPYFSNDIGHGAASGTAVTTGPIAKSPSGT